MPVPNQESPFARAAEWHETNCPGVEFSSVIESHALYGYVFITPDFFLLGRRVWSGWPEEMLGDPDVVAADGDCWHVWLAAGDWRGEWEKFLPYPLPHLSFHRRGKPRVWGMGKWRKEVSGGIGYRG